MKTIVQFIILMLTTFAFAQSKEIKFGKVSDDDLQKQEHHLDKEAEAAILYKKERLFYDYDSNNGFRTIRDAHYRIKVYKKSGLDWATVEVPLYTSSSGEETISQIKGYTFNLQAGKVQEVKLKKDGIFKENVSKFRNKVSITMPNVKEGSVIDIVYRIVSDLSGYMDDFQFQYGIPVDAVDVTVEIPQYFMFKRYGKGFYPLDIKQSRKNRKLTVQYKEENEPGRLNGGNRTSNLEFFENVYKISSSNIPALKEVDYTDNIDNYRSALTFELASTQFPNSLYKNYSKTWEDVAKSIYQFDDFGDELRKSRFYKEDIDALIAAKEDKGQLVQAIFNFVKERMTWNDYTGVGCGKGVKKAYEDKTGNVADINLMLTSMLRYAGFNANPVVVSTKSHGIPLFPTTNGFNYVVTALEHPNGSVDLLDATDKMAAINTLPSRALNWNGRLIREDGSSMEVKMTSSKPSKQNIFMNAILSEDGSVSGKMRTQNTGHIAMNYRKSHKDETWDEIMEDIEEKYVEMEVDQLEIKNEKTHAKPLIESCSFSKDNQIEIISGKMYFKPALFYALNENPFKMETRDYPVDFVYPQIRKVVINYQIPEGYQIESMPESVSLSLPQGLGNFQFSMKQNGSQLQFSTTTSINQSLIPPNYYASLKEFYNQMVVKHNEKIVLSKI